MAEVDKSAQEIADKYLSEEREKGKVVIRRKPIWKRIFPVHTAEDLQAIETQVIDGILIPYFIDSIVDAISSALNMFFYDSSISPRRRAVKSDVVDKPSWAGNNKTDYAKSGRSRRESATQNDQNDIDLKEIILIKPTQKEAKDLIRDMLEYFETYHDIPVDWLLGKVDKDRTVWWTYNKWGWKNAEEIYKITATPWRGVWRIVMPPAKYLLDE